MTDEAKRCDPVNPASCPHCRTGVRRTAEHLGRVAVEGVDATAAAIAIMHGDVVAVAVVTHADDPHPERTRQRVLAGLTMQLEADRQRARVLDDRTSRRRPYIPSRRRRGSA